MIFSDRLQRPDEIRTTNDAERAALVERLCASIAHALADRLMVIAGRVEQLASGANGETRAHAAEVQSLVRQASELVRSARAFGEQLRPPAEETHLALVLETALEEHRPLADARRLRIIAAPVGRESVMLPGGSLLVTLRALLGFVVARCAVGTETRISLVLCLDRLEIRLELPRGTPFPRDLHGIVDPWFSEPDGHEKARLLLALAIGGVRDRGGSVAIEDESRHPVITLSWPVPIARTHASEERTIDSGSARAV